MKPQFAVLLKPSNLGRIATLLPQSMNRLLLQTMINRVFAEQIDEGEFEFLEGRKLQIEVIDAAVFIGVSFAGNKIICHHFYHKPCRAEVTLSLQSVDAISLVEQQVDPDTLFFQRRLKINGDTELAHQVKNTIDTLNPELLPPLLMTLIAQYKNRVLHQ